MFLIVARELLDYPSIGDSMARKIVTLLLCAFLFSAMTVAAADSSTAAMPAAIELRQYLTMLIVGVVCVAGGVILFFKTSH